MKGSIIVGWQCSIIPYFYHRHCLLNIIGKQDHFKTENLTPMIHIKIFKISALFFCFLFFHHVALSQSTFVENHNIPDLNINNSPNETQIHVNPQKGFTGILEMGVVVGDRNRLKLNAIGSYFVAPWLSTGIGTGFRVFQVGDDRTVPLFADFRFYPGKNNSSLFIAAGAGASFKLNNGEHNPMLLFSFTVGTRFQVSRRSFINLNIGYEMQEEIAYVGHWSHIVQPGAVGRFIGTPVKIKQHGATASLGFSF
jgi:hypothetical protein